MIWIILVISLTSLTARADCASPTGVAGQFQFNTPNYQVCDGTGWSSMAAATPSGSCTGAGTLSYSAGPRFCNGSLYVSMAGSETGASCSGTATGTFQYFPALAYTQWCNGTNWKPMRNPATPFAFVQQAKIDSYNGTNTSTTAAFDGSGNVTTGNTVVCLVVHANGTNGFTSVVATGSQAFTRVVGPFVIGGSAQYMSELWYRSNITGSTGTRVTVTGAVTTGNMIVICNEYSGVATVNALDQAAGSGNQPGPTSVAGPVTTTSAKELIVAAGCWDSVAAAVGSGYTQRRTFLNDCLTEDRIVTTPGSYSATFGGPSNTTARGHAMMITLRAAP